MEQRYPDQAIDVIKNAGRPMASWELEACGFSRTALKRLVEAGKLEKVARGIYSATDKNLDEDSGRELWAAISMRIPQVVFCLESAATYHGISQNMGMGLYIALPKDMKRPSPETTGNVRSTYLSWRESTLSWGIETVVINGVDVRITDQARTIVDLFRYSSLMKNERTQKLVDQETVIDAFHRYIAKEGIETASSQLRKAAKPFGLWDRLKDLISFSTAQRPSLD